MKVIRHQHESNEFALHFNAQTLALFEESIASRFPLKDWETFAHVSGDEVQCSGKVSIRPFAGHGRE
jgi:hypothetical protein